ncbi:uncharacterized protein LOC108032969 [Drosophila biarmipes]|uniref:uncharacterized protein LOC108032969 n=1 Tax=Drosophila biarmipes TaxID=125945 RepID=UPI0021CC8EAD|nr:uncharacterized protein LOC108032969 [Drosophila biarmipes]XP_043949149.2 uncharacterized protein LOC108032969 [Drosophila biarmipes]
MLKWAVNQPRNSYLAKELALGTGPGSEAGAGADHVAGSSYSEFHALRGKLRRKSLSLGLGKENQLTSTPLPASSLTLHTRTPPLKDLSNILATPPSAGGGGAPGAVPPTAAAPPKFACTLPTFEAEYSPNATVIPGSLIALRGVGIPDSYFEKPRYLEQKDLPHPAPPAAGQTTLSSSQMGDVTLERMIDAILESNRKVLPNARQPRQHLRQRHRQQVLRSSHSHAQVPSPTYRPAFDPASDLCEYWKSPSRRDSLPADGFEEREVCSPVPLAPNPVQSQGKRHSLQLRRQRVVRRKRKITTKISSSVRQSAQKLLAAARSGSAVPSQRCAQKRRHISPDSGHNSTSDFEEELMAMGSFGGRAEAVTKRRLSFSFAEDLFVDK